MPKPRPRQLACGSLGLREVVLMGIDIEIGKSTKNGPPFVLRALPLAWAMRPRIVPLQARQFLAVRHPAILRSEAELLFHPRRDVSIRRLTTFRPHSSLSPTAHFNAKNNPSS